MTVSIKDAPLKLCKDCKHYSENKLGYGMRSIKCHALDGTPDIEDGEPINGLDLYRTRAALCGWNYPRFWQPKEPKP